MENLSSKLYEPKNQPTYQNLLAESRPFAPKSTSNSFDKAESLIANMPKPPRILPHTEAYFSYMPDRDSINIPYSELYPQKEDYYKGLFHELIHATGHPIRLYRRSLDYGCHDHHARAMEEIIAEMGAISLCHEASISLPENVLDHALNYIGHWASHFKHPYRMINRISRQTSQAVDYVLNRLPAKPF